MNQTQADQPYPEIKKLMQEIHADMVRNGFYDEREGTAIIREALMEHTGHDENDPAIEALDKLAGLNVGQQLMQMVTELAEGWEAYRRHDAPDDKLPQYSGLTVELADAVIRIFDTAEAMGLPLPEAMRDKIIYNRSRPYKHGKSC